MRGQGVGGGCHTFILKIVEHLFPFLTGRIDTIIYDLMMRKRSKKKAKRRYGKLNLFCMFLWQNWAARIMGH